MVSVQHPLFLLSKGACVSKNMTPQQHRVVLVECCCVEFDPEGRLGLEEVAIPLGNSATLFLG